MTTPITMTYAKWYLKDWMAETLELNLEEEGMYCRFCNYMYSTGLPLIDDDISAAKKMRVHINQYRKVMPRLVEKGKIVKAQGHLISDRVLKEIDRFRLENAARSEAARKREAVRKAALEVATTKAVQSLKDERDLKQLAGDLGVDPWVDPQDVPGVTSGLTLGLTDEKPNGINGHHTTAVVSLCPILESRIQNKKEDSTSNEVHVADATPGVLVPVELPKPTELKPVEMNALEAFQAYNDLAQRVGLPMARTLTPQRRKSLLARLREHGGMVAWREMLANVERSDFLQGKVKDWRIPGLQWLLKPENFCKVIEGAYSGGKKSTESDLERYSRILAESDGVRT